MRDVLTLMLPLCGILLAAPSPSEVRINKRFISDWEAPGAKRCNFDDRHMRKRRYALSRGRWLYTLLTWRLSDPYSLFKSEDDYKTLLFDEVENSTTPVDIDIHFAAFDHSDFENFDGPGGVVAHTTYPMDGQVHFDASEHWTTLADIHGVDLRYVAMHELGHALGLRHSQNPQSVMHATYRGSKHSLIMHKDDIMGIQRLYPRFVPKSGLSMIAKLQIKMPFQPRSNGCTEKC